MALHTVIGPQALKSFTKTLTCLSRYGDDVVVQATSDAIILAVTNSAKSAYFKVKLLSTYFDKYTLKPLVRPETTFQTPPDVESVTGQLLVKSVLSILKHRTVEKTVDRCDLSIVESGQDSGDPDLNDLLDKESLSSKLILRLHCKHGVVKTHHLLLFTPNNLGAPIVSNTFSSYFTIGPDTMRDLLDHFPQSRGDPQLALEFAVKNVVLRSIETARSRDRSAGQLTTEISLSADEFDTYSIGEPPVNISFHLREFNAVITLAEFLSVPLKMHFNLSAQPVVITFDSDTADAEYLAMISTSQRQAWGKANPLKRIRTGDGDGGDGGATKKTPRTALNMASKSASQAASSLPPQQDEVAPRKSTPNGSLEHSDPQPLFLPGASQDVAPPPPTSHSPVTDFELISSASLEIEHMCYDEFEAMMEGEGEEVGMSTAVGQIPVASCGKLQNEDDDDGPDIMMAASQARPGRYRDKEFQALFND